MRRPPGFGGTACMRKLGNSTTSPGEGCGLIHLSALYGPDFTAALSCLNENSVPPGAFMNTVRESGWVGVRYTTPEMKLFAWLCIAWRPPGSSTLTHISLSDQPS